MKLRTYRAPTVEAALKRAATELGDQAVFVGSRENPGEPDEKERHDVTFALFDAEETRKRNAAANRTDPELATAAAAGTGADREPDRLGLKIPSSRTSSPLTSTGRETQDQTVGFTTPRIDRPHWKRFVLTDLKATLTRGPEIDGSTSVPSAPAAAGSGAAAQPALAPSLSSSEPPDTVQPSSDAPSISPQPDPSNARSGSHALVPSPAPSRVAAALEAELQTIRHIITTELATRPFATIGESGYLSEPSRAALLARLLAAELDPDLCTQLLLNLAPADATDPNYLVARLRERLAELFEVAPDLQPSAEAPLVAAFVGPNGSGKTSAAVKLAIRCAVAEHRRVHLVAVSGQRIGAAEPAASYARLAQIPFTLVDRESNLLDRLRPITAANPVPEVVLVDLPGYTDSTRDRAVGLAAQLAAIDNVDTHLESRII